ncbi:MAG: LptF/LptG family permease [Spirochaetaceae bacterium]|nr:LptF/LptG family permease [Spirochaetaceae bacterium]MDT8297530.1 LptF/LptG family permease [Spirochaetaceae bacterium]
MRMFRRLLIREFIPFFLLGILFFALILILADVFTNLWRYLNREVPFGQAIMVSFLYGPKALSYALPIGSMFAAAFALGNLGARNELIAVFGSGVPLIRFAAPILVIAAIISVGGYVLEDQFAIPMMKERNAKSKELLGIQDSANRSRAVAIARGGRVVYYADFYNDENKTLSGLTVIILDDQDAFMTRIDAERAIFEESRGWLLEGCRVFRADADGEIIQERFQRFRDPMVDEEPATFRLDTRELEEMDGVEARQWIETQKRAGLPYKSFQAKYYQRFTMALTPFLVVLFSGAIGGRFKRNILLMSLLASLGLSSAWYIVRMISTLLAEIGMISPLVGAAAPYIGFLALGVWIFRYAKT